MPPKKKDEKRGDVEEASKEEVGIFYFADGSKYDGQYISKKVADAPAIVKRHGNGIYEDNGTRYDGSWVDDEMQGEGKITFATDEEYEGSFANGMFCGRGAYRWKDGRSYEGQWRDNLMHGEGVFVDAEGRRWSGRFYDGKGFNLVLEA